MQQTEITLYIEKSSIIIIIIIIREVTLRNKFYRYSIVVPLKKLKNMVHNRISVIYHANEEKKIRKNFLIKFCNACFHIFHIIISWVDMDKAKTIFRYYSVLFAIKFTSGENPCLSKTTQCLCSNDRVDCSNGNITAIPSKFPSGTKQM